MDEACLSGAQHDLTRVPKARLAILVSFGGSDLNTESVTWTLLPNVAQALEELGWVMPGGSYQKSFPVYADPTPVATPDEYRRALLTVRNKYRTSARDLAMLRAHFFAPSHAITGSQLAEAMQFKNYRAANLHYGGLAHRLADALGIQPSKRLNGSVAWWRILGYGTVDREPDQHFEWVMRPELVEALIALKWFDAQHHRSRHDGRPMTAV